MSAEHIAELVGILFASWATGFGMGLLITAFRKFTDSI